MPPPEAVAGGLERHPEATQRRFWRRWDNAIITKGRSGWEFEKIQEDLEWERVQGLSHESRLRVSEPLSPRPNTRYYDLRLPI